MENEVNQLKEEVKEIRGYVEMIVGVLEMAHQHMVTISNSCNCLREDLELAVTSDELNIKKEGKI